MEIYEILNDEATSDVNRVLERMAIESQMGQNPKRTPSFTNYHCSCDSNVWGLAPHKIF